VQDLIQEFIAQRRFAIIGATDNREKYGYQIFKNLRSRGYEVYPVNPRLNGLEGISIPVKVDVVDFVVPPKVTEQILKECKHLGLHRIWLQPGSESAAAIAFCNGSNLRVVYGVCVTLN